MKINQSKCMISGYIKQFRIVSLMLHHQLTEIIWSDRKSLNDLIINPFLFFTPPNLMINDHLLIFLLGAWWSHTLTRSRSRLNSKQAFFYRFIHPCIIKQVILIIDKRKKLLFHLSLHL